MDFELTVLGCGSATPTLMYSPSAQVVSHGTESLLIDCGEGTQIKLRRASFSFQRIGHVFISHLHGDHYFGFQGLLSTMQLLGRTRPLHIYAHEDLMEATYQQLRIARSYLKYELVWHKLQYEEMMLIADLPRIEVFSFPLQHRIPTCGFLVREKPKLRNIKAEAIEKYNLSVARIRQVKAGADLQLEDGRLIPNAELTTEPTPLRSYAYCSDTAPRAETSQYVKGVDLLYHESTFLEQHKERARKTFHSTAAEAAAIARDAGVNKLLLGHFSARYRNTCHFLDEARTVFPHTDLAVEGLTIPIGTVHK